MQLLSVLSHLFLFSTIVNGYYHNNEARSADLDSFKTSLYGRAADPEPEDGLMDIWGRDLDVRDAHILDDDDFPLSLLARELTGLYIRDLKSTVLEDRDILDYHYARASKAPSGSKGASGGKSPSPPSGGKGKSPSAGPAGGSSGGLAFPNNVQPDGQQLHAWKRLYVEMKQFNKADGTGINHDLLIRNTKDHGGHHSSLVVGDGHRFMETDLQFEDENWIKKAPSGKGYPALAAKMDWISDAKIKPELKMGRSVHTHLGPLNKAETFDTVHKKGTFD